MPLARAPVTRHHHQLDAAQVRLGRLATAAARLLIGKHKPTYQPNRDDGDFVTVVNAGQLQLSGRKIEQKHYHDMSGFPGGIRERKVSELLVSRPGEIIRRSIYYMIPKNRLHAARMRRLRITQ